MQKIDNNDPIIQVAKLGLFRWVCIQNFHATTNSIYEYKIRKKVQYVY
jgi:hypothetical protein